MTETFPEKTHSTREDAGESLAPVRRFPADTLIKAAPGVIAGFSTALPPGTDRVLAGQVSRLLNEWLPEVSVNPLLLAQYHSARVLETGAGGSGVVDGEGDAYAANGSSRLTGDGVWGRRGDGRLLVVKTADCVPVLALHPELGVHAALHAGWRGAAAGILPHLLNLWKRAGGNPAGVHLAFGPHIRGCCYEVGPECVEAFQPGHLNDAVTRPNGKPHLSLARVLANQAEEAGVPAAQVDPGGPCTRCHVDAQGDAPFASYRRDGAQGGRPGARNVSFIALLPQP